MGGYVQEHVYRDKCMTLLSDQNVYQEFKDLAKSIHNKGIRHFSDLKTI